MRKYSYFSFAIALVVGLALYFMPYKPTLTASTALKAEDVSVDKAITLMKTANPMAGIQMLKQIVEKDPKNLEALYPLAFFSIQSGQIDKAIERFQQILAIDSTRTDALYYLSGIYVEQGKYEDALRYLELFKTKNKDEKLAPEIEANIQEVKHKLNDYAKR
jgi:cytochrome c-type biogenesis protein CcmH/NrfG